MTSLAGGAGRGQVEDEGVRWLKEQQYRMQADIRLSTEFRGEAVCYGRILAGGPGRQSRSVTKTAQSIHS